MITCQSIPCLREPGPLSCCAGLRSGCAVPSQSKVSFPAGGGHDCVRACAGLLGLVGDGRGRRPGVQGVSGVRPLWAPL